MRISLKNILLEAEYGKYSDTAQNRALNRVGKKYGTTGKKTTPKIDISKVKIPKVNIPKFEMPVSSPAHPDYKKYRAQKIAKEKKIREKYKNKDRAPNIQSGVDVIKDSKDLEHFLNDFENKADKVDRIDHEKFVKGQFSKQVDKLPLKEQKELASDIDSWKVLGGYEAIQRAIKDGKTSEQDVRDRNKRISEISHKTITKVKQPIERGISIPNEDVDKFLERFKIDEMVDIPDESGHGSSGFSISGKTARSFSGFEYSDEGAQADDSSIIMRISPNKNGELRGLFVDGQEKPDGGHWSEGEITRSSKSKAKCIGIKKVKYPSGKMVYIIDMQEPDDLTTESLKHEDIETTDDLSRKYLEGPLNSKPRLRKSVKEGMIKLQEIIPGTIMDLSKESGDVWQLVISKRWAAVGPRGYRMAYKANSQGKKHALKWAKTGRDHLGNDERRLHGTDKIPSLA